MLLCCLRISFFNTIQTMPEKHATKYYNTFVQLECGPMPNVMDALSNIGGALCSTPQTLADAHY